MDKEQFQPKTIQWGNPSLSWGISPRGLLGVLWVSEILLSGLNLFPPSVTDYQMERFIKK